MGDSEEQRGVALRYMPIGDVAGITLWACAECGVAVVYPAAHDQDSHPEVDDASVAIGRWHEAEDLGPTINDHDPTR